MGSLIFYNFHQSSIDFVNLIITYFQKKSFQMERIQIGDLFSVSSLIFFRLCFSTAFIRWQLYLVTLNKLQTEHFYFFHRIFFVCMFFQEYWLKQRKLVVIFLKICFFVRSMSSRQDDLSNWIDVLVNTRTVFDSYLVRREKISFMPSRKALVRREQFLPSGIWTSSTKSISGAVNRH